MKRPGFKITRFDEAETDVILLDPNPEPDAEFGELRALLDDTVGELRGTRARLDRVRRENETLRGDLIRARVEIVGLQTDAQYLRLGIPGADLTPPAGSE